MIYVMSDLHGDYGRYMKMLEKINLKESDTLYILGDVIDRGDSGIRILQHMMYQSNIIPILGNHEYMASVCLSWLMTEITNESIKSTKPEIIRGLSEWKSVGGETTISEFCKLSRGSMEDIIEYLSEFELFAQVKAGGNTFVLVHAGLDNFSPNRPLEDYDLSELIFKAPDFNRVYFESKFLVTGHLPTREIWLKYEGAARDEIFEKNRHISIDCGCGYDGRLGCICLDTMEKFYV